MTAETHPALKLNHGHASHHVMRTCEACYQLEFAALPYGHLPEQVFMNRVLLRKVRRDLTFPYTSNWARPKPHLNKHFSGQSKVIVEGIFELVAEDIQNLIDDLRDSGVLSEGLIRQEKVLHEALKDAKIYPEVKYYALPYLLALLLEIAVLALPLESEENDLPSSVLRDLTAWLVYPHDDPTSFEFRCAYNGLVSDRSWHLITAIRMGRSTDNYRRFSSPPWAPRGALSLGTSAFVTVFDRADRRLNPLVGKVSKITFR